MSTYITRTNGAYGPMPLSKQATNTQILKKFGVQPISFYYQQNDSESDESLSARLDGILAGLSFGDNLVLQLPTFMGFRFVNQLLDKFEVYRQNSDSKLILYICDDLLYDPQLKAGSDWIKLLNRGDVLVVNSPETAQHLADLGVSRHKYSFFKICDVLTDAIDQFEPRFSAQLNVINGSNEVVSKLAKAGFVVNAFGGDVTATDDIKVTNIGMADHSLPYRLARNGGWVVIWPGSPADQFCTAYPFSLALSAGLPVVVKSGTIEARWAKKYGLGLVVDSEEEAVHQISRIEENTYLKYQVAARQIGKLSSTGWFTEHAIESATWDD